MKTARFNIRFYAKENIPALVVVALSLLLFYSGSPEEVLSIIIKAEVFVIILLGFFGSVKYFVVRLETTADKKLVYKDLDFIWSETIKIDDILEIYRTPKLKSSDTIIEGLSVVYKDDHGQQKRMKINLRLFRPEDVAGILKEIFAMNSNVRIDEYCEKLARGEYLKIEQEKSLKNKEDVRKNFDLWTVIRTVLIVLLAAVVGIVLSVIGVLYFTGPGK